MLDLETQLSRNKTELNQLRRNKEDVSDLQGMLLLCWWCQHKPASWGHAAEVARAVTEYEARMHGLTCLIQERGLSFACDLQQRSE